MASRVKGVLREQDPDLYDPVTLRPIFQSGERWQGAALQRRPCPHPAPPAAAAEVRLGALL